MGTSLFVLLALATLVVFSGLMIFTTYDRNRLYIQYILLAYPFMAMDFFPAILNTTIFDFITIVFIVLFYKPRQTTIKYGKTYWYVFIFLTVIAVLGIVNAENQSMYTASAFLQYITTFCFAKILIDECLVDDSFIYSVLNALKITLLVSLCFLAAQFVYGTAFTFERSLNANVISGLSIRYPSFFQDPQKYAQFLAVSSLLLLVYKKSSSRYFILNILLLVISILAMMFTGGRAGLGGWVLGVFFILLLGSKKYKLAVLSAGLILFYFAYNYTDSLPMFNRLSSLNDDYSFRYSIWEDAIGIFKSNPFLGIGIGNYAEYVSIHNPDQFWMTDNAFSYFDHPESGYLKFLTEFGLFGFLAILTLLMFPLINGIQVFFKTHNANVLPLIAALLSWLVGFYTLYSFDDARIRILTVTVICLIISSPKWSLAESNDK